MFEFWELEQGVAPLKPQQHPSVVNSQKQKLRDTFSRFYTFLQSNTKPRSSE